MGLEPWPDTDPSTITFPPSSSTLLHLRYFFPVYFLSSFTIFSSSVSVSLQSSYTIFFSVFVFLSYLYLRSFFFLCLCFSPIFIYDLFFLVSLFLSFLHLQLFFRLSLISIFIYNLSFSISVSHLPIFTIFFSLCFSLYLHLRSFLSRVSLFFASCFLISSASASPPCLPYPRLRPEKCTVTSGAVRQADSPWQARKVAGRASVGSTRRIPRRMC